MSHFILDLSCLEKSAECCGVYSIVNLVNGKKYIGSSMRIAKRITQHFAMLESNRHPNRYLQASWNKHGKENFEFKILEIAEPSFQYIREQFYLESEQPEYNISTLATGFSGTVSTETRQKISVAAKRMWLNPEIRRRISEGLKGKMPSEASIQALRERNRQRIYTEAMRQELSERHKGKTLSVEHKQKISERLKGRSPSQETRQKIADSLRGNVRPEEVRQKLSEAATGRQFSEETIRKRAVSIKAAHAKRSPEERSEAVRRGWITRRMKGE